MDLKLQRKSKAIYAFLMALFSVWGWAQTTVTYNFGATGAVTGLNATTPVSIDANIGFASFKNSGTADPVISGGQLRLYQNTTKGGSIKIYPTNGAVISKVVVYASGSGGTGPARYSVNTVGSTSLSINSGAYTINSINGTTEVEFWNVGSSSSTRTYVDKFEVTYTITPTSSPLVTGASLTGTVGTVFSHQINATQNPNSYSLVAGSLPGGLTLNPTTGEITGTPTGAGVFNTTIKASNSAGDSPNTNFDFTIAKGNQVLTAFTDQTKYLSSPSFTLPLNSENANLPVSYTSSNPSAASVSGNTVTIVGMGSTTITATQSGNADWNLLNQQIVVTVSADPVTYAGIGRFEKITSTSDLTDGYYVITNENGDFLMTSNRVGADATGYFNKDNSNQSNNIIVNPTIANVWKIESNGNAKTIFNENASRYVGRGNTSGGTSSWEASSSSATLWVFSYLNSKWEVENSGKYLASGNSDNRFTAYVNTNQQELQLFKRIETTIWNGTSWSNGSPDAKDVIITGSYSTVSQPSFTAKNITIKNGGVLELTSNNTISAVDVTVEDGGNLIQKDGSVLSFTGAFKALKNGTSEVNKYAFWSSPVVSQNLTNMYTAGTPAFITVYDTATDSYVNAASTTSVFAKAYSIKTPVANAALVFEGTPNTGTQTYTLATSGNGFNLIGNPYPSSLSLGAFYTANAARISSTFYFWDNKSTNVTLQNGATTTNYGYATFNAANGANPTWVPAPNGNGGTAVVPTGAVANIGQGFIVKTLNTSVDTSLTFNNEMRGATNGTFFNKNNSATEGKFWLRLNSEYNTNNTFAVDYTDGASDSFDNYDSKAIGMGSDGFYTLADSQKLIIQGKASFDINDVVPVGLKHFQNGNFTIALVQKEGLFNNGQAIYLHDKITGAYTDLQNNAYTFSANAGETADRFEIVYKLNVLATAEIKKDAFEVFRDGQDFVVRNDKNVEKVEIFDAAGRKIQTINENSKVIRVQLSSKGVYILKALSQGKEYTKKIFK